MILWLDGFDHYNTISLKYQQSQAGYQAVSTTYARPSQHFTGNGLQLRAGENSLDSYFSRGGLRSTSNAMYIGVACRITPSAGPWPPAQDRACIQARDSKGNFVAGLGFKNLTIYAYNWDGSFTGNAGIAIDQNEWFYVELGVLCHPSAGWITVRHNGVELANWTGISTMSLDDEDPNLTNPPHSGILNEFRLRGVRETIFDGEGATLWFDDLYVLNNIAPNNSFLGDVTIYPIYPSGTGTYSQWSVTGTATNWEAVDEAPPNTTDYVYSSGTGTVDTYVYESLPSALTTVHGLQADLYAGMGTGWGRIVSPIAYSGTAASGTMMYLGQGWAYHYEDYDVDPVDSNTWTVDKVNDHEFGVKVEV